MPIIAVPDPSVPVSVEQAEIIMERLGLEWQEVRGGTVEDRVISVLLAAVIRLDARVRELEDG